MATTYDIKLFDPNGIAIGSLNAFLDLDVVLVENDVGALTMSLPPTVPISYLKKDGRIAIYRSVNGRLPSLLGGCVWLIRRRKKTIVGGERRLMIWAVHPNHLLKRRVVAYSANTSYTSKTDNADDIIKAIARENLGSLATDTARQLSSAIFSVQADTGSGPTVAKAFTRRNVLAVCQEIADTSAQAGTYTGFEIFSPTETTYALRTYTGQRGVDRSSDSGSPVFVALDNIEVDDDWMDELTYVYAGGTGIGANRSIGTAEDTTLSGESPFGRIEYFWDGRQTDDTTLLADDAEALLRANRGRKIITGDVKDTPQAAFGIHYDWGDIVAIDVDGDVRDVRIDRVRLTYSRASGETLKIAIRSE